MAPTIFWPTHVKRVPDLPTNLSDDPAWRIAEIVSSLREVHHGTRQGAVSTRPVGYGVRSALRTEEKCRGALFCWRWPAGFECPACGGFAHDHVGARCALDGFQIGPADYRWRACLGWHRGEVVNKQLGCVAVTTADEPRDDQLAIGINAGPGPRVVSAIRRGESRPRTVLHSPWPSLRQTGES